MAYRYYSFPRKQKSKTTLDREDALKKTNKVIILKNLEKLNNSDLEKQKKIYQNELDLVIKKYSKSNYLKMIKSYDDIKSKIEKRIKEFEKFSKQIDRKLSIKNTYFIFKALWAIISQLHIREINCDNEGTLNEIINEETNYANFLKKTNVEETISYFMQAFHLINEQSKLFKLKIINVNIYSEPWDSKMDHLRFSEIDTTFYKTSENFFNIEKMSFSNFKSELSFNTSPNQSYNSKYRSFSDYKMCEKSDFKEGEETITRSFDQTNLNKKIKNNKETNLYHTKILNSEFKLPPLTMFKAKEIILHFNKVEEILRRYVRKIELIQRSKLKNKEKKENFGYVYVLKSVGYPGMYKIGSTYGLAEERAEELSGTNVPDPWTVAVKIKILDALYYEKQMHKILTKYRYRKSREFFKVDLSVIKKCLSNILESSDKGRKKVTFPVLKN
jgi:hypothetical protein